MAFTPGVNFKCNASICYGIGAVHETFKALQQVLNQYASSAGFVPLTIDGFIGTATVDAVQRVANQLGLTVAGTTRETIAAHADALISQLQRSPIVAEPTAPDITAVIQETQAACHADRSSAPCMQAKQLCRTVRGTANAKLPGIAELCAPRLPTWLRWTLGGVAVAALVGGGTYAYRRHKRSR